MARAPRAARHRASCTAPFSAPQPRPATAAPPLPPTRQVYDSDQSRLLYPVNYLRNYARMQVGERPPQVTSAACRRRHEHGTSRPPMAVQRRCCGSRPSEGPRARCTPLHVPTRALPLPPDARPQVRTRLLAMIDVDMYMSASLSDELRDPQRCGREGEAQRGSERGWAGRPGAGSSRLVHSLACTAGRSGALPGCWLLRVVCCAGLRTTRACARSGAPPCCRPLSPPSPARRAATWPLRSAAVRRGPPGAGGWDEQGQRAQPLLHSGSCQRSWGAPEG
jgi:hypothetical protein